MFIGVAMAESTGIYAFVVALILLFANPFIGKALIKSFKQDLLCMDAEGRLDKWYWQQAM